MAHSEKSRQSEGNVYISANVSDDDAPSIKEDFMPRDCSDKDGPDQCALENVCPSEHMIHLGDFCCEKWGQSDSKPNPAGPKEPDQSPPPVPSNPQGGVLVDLSLLGSQGTGMDLLGKMDFDADLESGREINGTFRDFSFWGSARGLVVKAWCGVVKGDFSQRFDGCPFGGTKMAGLGFNQRLNKLFVAKPAKKPNVPQPAVQRTENRVAKTADIGSEGPGKLRTENDKANLKPSCKKPPRPPRPPRAASHPKKERLLKGGYSDMAMSRAAKLERMRSLMKSKVPKSSSSSSSVWALVFTFCFCVVLIMQGLYSQGAGAPRDSSVAAAETSPVSVHNYGKSARSGDRLQAMIKVRCAQRQAWLLCRIDHSPLLAILTELCLNALGLGRVDEAGPIPSHLKAWKL